MNFSSRQKKLRYAYLLKEEKIFSDKFELYLFLIDHSCRHSTTELIGYILIYNYIYRALFMTNKIYSFLYRSTKI